MIFHVLVLACSATFTTSNALQKFGHHSCAPWQFLLYRGAFQIVSMMLFRFWSLSDEINRQVSKLFNSIYVLVHLIIMARYQIIISMSIIFFRALPMSHKRISHVM